MPQRSFELTPAQLRLYERHEGLVELCLYTRFPHEQRAGNMWVDDLLQAGRVSLMDCARRYDRSVGSFQNYATPRVVGAIRDELRNLDWYPRAVRREARENGVMLPGHSSLNRILEREDHDGHLRDGIHPKALVFSEDYEEIERAEETEQIWRMMSCLPRRERIVVILWFFEGMTQPEIGRVFGVSGSRISQLQTKACERMRVWMSRQNA